MVIQNCIVRTKLDVYVFIIQIIKLLTLYSYGLHEKLISIVTKLRKGYFSKHELNYREESFLHNGVHFYLLAGDESNKLLVRRAVTRQIQNVIFSTCIFPKQLLELHLYVQYNSEIIHQYGVGSRPAL